MCVHEGRHPVGGDVDRRARVVYIGKHVAWQAAAPVRKDLRVPRSPERGISMLPSERPRGEATYDTGVQLDKMKIMANRFIKTNTAMTTYWM